MNAGTAVLHGQVKANEPFGLSEGPGGSRETRRGNPDEAINRTSGTGYSSTSKTIEFTG
ncbi:hypothetical protein [Jannaschia formosa]|uniref:hypothetical protein n=1 Tax=Jannaschia formosa TaxID=2259592 RepID=UPI001431B995|nr:hypothetical protein [Jannaschia formosa]